MADTNSGKVSRPVNKLPQVSLLQVEGIGRNIVPVFYAVTRPASINFLVFLAIVVWLVGKTWEWVNIPSGNQTW